MRVAKVLVGSVAKYLWARRCGQLLQEDRERFHETVNKSNPWRVLGWAQALEVGSQRAVVFIGVKEDRLWKVGLDRSQRLALRGGEGRRQQSRDQESWEPRSLSIAALMSPPVAIRACRLASRLIKPMELSCSSCC